MGRQLDCDGYRVDSRSTSAVRLERTSGTGCNDILVPGQSQQLGIKTKVIDGVQRPFWLEQSDGLQSALPAWRDDQAIPSQFPIRRPVASL